MTNPEIILRTKSVRSTPAFAIAGSLSTGAGVATDAWAAAMSSLGGKVEGGETGAAVATDSCHLAKSRVSGRVGGGEPPAFGSLGGLAPDGTEGFVGSVIGERFSALITVVRSVNPECPD